MPDQRYTDEELLDALRDAADDVDWILTWNHFDDVSDHSPATYQKRFGSWNRAKKLAGLRTVSEHGESESKQVYNEIKESVTCTSCGEGRVDALQFHHLPQFEKKVSVSKMVRDKYSVETIFEEVRKCVVLCANCHRCRHSDTDYGIELPDEPFEPTEHI